MAGQRAKEARWRRSGAGLLALVALALSACATPQPSPYRGLNLLQADGAPLNSPAARESFQRLRALGANTVALIPFLHQDDVTATAVHRTDTVTDEELAAAFRTAHRLGLQVVLKPQVLVAENWSGEIDPGAEGGWQKWFAAYTEALLHYARLAEQERVEWLVVGTELNRAAAKPYWPALIAAVRTVYHGRLTFAAHNIEGVRAFPYWSLLDSVGLTYYPSLGEEAAPAALRREVTTAVARLAALSQQLGRPLWLLEIGMPSARDSQHSPWQWRELRRPGVVADTGLQAMIIDLWLTALDQPWVEGVLVWSWRSDPEAGGLLDTRHLVQNKPAEAILRLHWRRCGE